MATAAPPPVWLPYCGAAPVPGALAGQWNLDPVLLLVMAGACAAWHRWASRPGPDRLPAFAAGMGVLFVLFVSPLCALTSALFAARAAHHAVLVTVAAPLLVWSLPRSPRIAAAPATAIAALVLWGWHVPALYAAALSSDALFWVMQASLLASAMAFWSAVRTASLPAAVAALLASMVQMGLLGALLASAGSALYAPHAGTTLAWGLTPLEDQQLAGLVMWAPAAAFYLLAALIVAGRWLDAERRVGA